MSIKDSGPNELKLEVQPRSAASRANAKTGARPHKRAAKTFPALAAILSHWYPNDTLASRNLLISEIIMKLEQEGHKCIPACIPAIIVDGKYPVDIIQYWKEQDLDDFMTRLLWMHKVYSSAIGLIMNVPDEPTSALIEEACGTFFSTEENCIVFIVMR